MAAFLSKLQQGTGQFIGSVRAQVPKLMSVFCFLFFPFQVSSDTETSHGGPDKKDKSQAPKNLERQVCVLVVT